MQKFLSRMRSLPFRKGLFLEHARQKKVDHSENLSLIDLEATFEVVVHLLQASPLCFAFIFHHPQIEHNIEFGCDADKTGSSAWPYLDVPALFKI